MVVKKILITGMPRSGSTLLFQIVRELIQLHGNNITLNRNHGGTKEKHYGKHDIVLFTVRDIFDITKSLSVTHESSIAETINEAFYLEYLCEFNAEYTNGHIIKYEDFLPYNEIKLIKHVNRMVFNNELSETHSSEILEKFSIEKNKKRAMRYENFKNYDEYSMIHGNHITSNGYGLKNSLTDDEKTLIINHPEVKKYINIYNAI